MMEDIMNQRARITKKGQIYFKELLLRKMVKKRQDTFDSERIEEVIQDIWTLYYLKHPLMFIKDKIKGKVKP